MKETVFDMGKIDIAWCPGCGNFGILNAVKRALAELEIAPERLVLVSGIGQAAKLPHYMRCNVFNGLHGRSLPAATAVKASNPALTVIAVSGDGCMYAEGGNHFIHAVRRNPGITHITHNNMVYGLTKGQASPTSLEGFRTPVQVHGVFIEPFNPVAVAVALDASFVARAYMRDMDRTVEIIKKAVSHDGYALVDILQPCVTFNRLNTYEWFREHTYYLEDDYDPSDRTAAFGKAVESERMALGVIYMNNRRKTFESQLYAYRGDDRPLHAREPDMEKLRAIVERLT